MAGAGHTGRPELGSIAVEGMTRSAFLLRGTLAAGAVYGLGAVTPFVSRALGQEAAGDITVLNFALTLEHVEAALYEQALEEVSGLSGDARRLVRELADNEREHVDALTRAVRDLDGRPAEAPAADFGRALSSGGRFLRLAQTLEDIGVSAYNGAAPEIESIDVLATAGGIAQVEARHAALVRLERGEDITPAAAFDTALSADEVRTRLRPFLSA